MALLDVLRDGVQSGARRWALRSTARRRGANSDRRDENHGSRGSSSRVATEPNGATSRSSPARRLDRAPKRLEGRFAQRCPPPPDIETERPAGGALCKMNVEQGLLQR